MQLLTKGNVFKVLALLIVVAFLLEIFAIQRNEPPQGDGDGTELPTEKTLMGIAYANATITSYGDSLGVSITVAKNHSNLSSTVESLKRDGLVAYTSNTKSGLVLNLAKGANLTEVIERLSPMGLPLSSRAEVTFKDPLYFRTENGTVKVVVRSVRITMDPTIPIGYQVGMRITASLVGDRMVASESLYDIIPIRKDLVVLGEITNRTNEFSGIAIVGWQARDISRSGLSASLSQAFQNVTVQTIINNTVAFDPPLSPGALANLTALNLSYLSSETKDGVKYPNSGAVLAKQDFSDSALLESDLAPILSAGNTTLAYPLSYARIDFRKENFTEGDWALLNSSMPNSTILLYRKSFVQIKDEIYDETGAKYVVLSRTASDFFPYSPNQTSGSIILPITVNLFGNKLLNYTVLEQ